MEIDIKDKAKDIVFKTVGEENEYLKRLVARYLQQEPKRILTCDKYNQIDAEITDKIRRIREEILTGNEVQNDHQLLINAILKEKLKDRKSAEDNRRHKWLVGVGAIILTIISNAFQYGINKAVEKC